METHVANTVPRKSLTDRTRAELGEVLSGRRRGASAAVLFAGPAVIASIAYMDPGNFATNIQAGSLYGYALLWVVVMANLIAMLFQALSAKLGIVTGRNLAELSRDNFSPATRYAMWGISEVAVMATDLAEFLGGAIGLSLLFGMPLIAGMAVTGIVTYGLLLFGGRGFRPMELIIGALVAIIGLCYVVELFIAPVAWAAVARGLVIPSIPDAHAMTLLVGIVGATVMPHAIYLHSALTQGRVLARDDEDIRKIVRFSNRECVVALAVAGATNAAMVIMASAAFNSGHHEVADIEGAYHTLTPLLGGAAAAVFLISLMASGIASSTVGTMAGQVIMQGFVNFHIPIWLRRLVTMVPAFVVVLLGANTTQALVYSQVVLSLALPIPMIALVLFTRRRAIMGEFVNSRLTDAAAIGGTVIVLFLNAVLLFQSVGVSLLGLKR